MGYQPLRTTRFPDGAEKLWLVGEGGQAGGLGRRVREIELMQ
jgi:hypothetical protein